MNSSVDNADRRVTFRACDIHYPKPLAVMESLYADQLIEGEVLRITEGDLGEQFALVRVPRLADPVLIAVSRLIRRFEA